MKNVKKFINPIFIILTAATLRLLPHLPNFAPISAMALFGGTYLNRKWAFAAPLSAMFLSNYLLLYVNPFRTPYAIFDKVYSPLLIFSIGLLPIYLSFIFSGIIGLWLKKHKTLPNIIGASLFCSVQFFAITNAAVWIGGMYDRSILGLWQSYIAGIPFFRGTFVGDLFYTALFFGAYELSLRFSKSKSTSAI